MGTSSSYSGPSDGPGLLPAWATDDVGGEADDGDDTAVEKPTEDNEDEGDVSDSSTPITHDPQILWRTAKGNMTRYATSDGDRDRLRSAGSGYVRAKGGARGASSSAISGKSASRRVGSFISSAARSGISEALGSIGLSDVVGQSADQVFARLVDALAPVGATKEEAAARTATVEVLEYLYNTLIGEDGDLDNLENMNQETVEEAVGRSVSGYIYNRWLDELGLSIERGAISESRAVQLEREVREYVRSCVQLELGNKGILDVDWDGPEGQQIIERVYQDAYNLLGTGL
jgi:hypothetical protein